MCRDRGYGQTEATCRERNGITASAISFLVGFVEDLGFRRMILKSDNERSTKSLQDAVIQAYAGVQVVPQCSHLRVITRPTAVWKWLYEK